MADCPQPGIYRNVPYEEYASWDALRASVLIHMGVPRVAQYRMAHPTESDALEFGTAWHACLLEPSRFEREFVIAPDFGHQGRKENKAAKIAWEAEHADATIVAAKQHKTMRGMLKGVWELQLAANILSAPGQNEVCAVWVDAETGVRCKARYDRICRYDLDGDGQEWTVIVDLKSTGKGLTVDEWRSAVFSYRYHVAAAFYLDGLRQLAPDERRFVWIASRKTPPHLSCVFEPEPDLLADGHEKMRRLIETYAECRKTGVWPGHPDRVVRVGLRREA